MPTKRGRKADRKQTNRRQKHELAYRAAKWKCSKLAVILADRLAYWSTTGMTAEWFLQQAKAELRRANREARRPKL